MTWTLVDLPDDLVRLAMELTGAPSKKAMINQALEELVNREAQLALIDWVQRGGLPGLTDPDVLADARRCGTDALLVRRWQWPESENASEPNGSSEWP